MIFVYYIIKPWETQDFQWILLTVECPKQGFYEPENGKNRVLLDKIVDCVL